MPDARLDRRSRRARTGADEPIIKLAVLAVGGQGGGVLADWITDVAERNGYVAQSTSVAGVAQRTGATIYYVEMCRDTGRRPVFALSPAQGDVDILIAAELMEAGRAIMRGFVTPDRTTLIASSHRIAAVSEKIEPGRRPRLVRGGARRGGCGGAKRFIAFDMEKIAAEAGSVISASLLGALAGSGVLPFPAGATRTAIAASGRGARASLLAFAGAFEAALRQSSGRGRRFGGRRRAGPAGCVPVGPEGARPGTPQARVAVAAGPRPGLSGAAARHGAEGDSERSSTTRTLAYGRDYLDLLDEALALDDAGRGHRLSLAAAKHRRQCHVLRRHHPRRRSEDPVEARGAGAPRGRRER